MKKIAIRGIIILAVVVVCSMFFSQTIVTITTPKVKVEIARQGKFEDKMTFTGKVYFAETENITPEGAKKNAVTIDKLYVKAGDYVEEGTRIADASLSSDYDDTLKAARDEVVSAQTAYLSHESENIRIVANTDTDKNNALRTAENAFRTLMDAQDNFVAVAAEKGIFISVDTTTWAGIVQEAGDADLTEAMEAVMDAQSKKNTADNRVLEVFRTSHTRKEIFDFIEKRVTLQRTIDDAQEKVLRIVTEAEQAKFITAPRAGYITELNLEAGQVYDGSRAAYVLSVESEPMLRCDISGNEREFAEGMTATIKGEYDNIKSSVVGVVREGISGKYLHVALDKDIITRLGGMRALMGASLDVNVTYKSKQNTTLLPASSVRNEGENLDFVYVIDYEYDFWGSKMKLRKQSVTVVERGDTEVSISEEMRNTQIADKEDRAIADGKYVMEYVN